MTKLNSNELNKAVILDQLQDHWQKMAALIVWKCAKKGTIKITQKDIEGFSKAFPPGMPVLLTHGHIDSIDFKLVSEEEAKVLVAHNETLKGTA
jgi:hypothetical protein